MLIILWDILCFTSSFCVSIDFPFECLFSCSLVVRLLLDFDIGSRTTSGDHLEGVWTYSVTLVA